MKLVSYEVKGNTLYIVRETDEGEEFRAILDGLDEIPQDIDYIWTDEQKQAARDALDNIDLTL